MAAEPRIAAAQASLIVARELLEIAYSYGEMAAAEEARAILKRVRSDLRGIIDGN